MIFGDSGFLHRSFRNTVGVLIWTWAIFVFMIEYYGGGVGNNNDVRPPIFRDVFVLLVKVLIAAPFGTCVAGDSNVDRPPGFSRGPANVQYMAMNPDGQYSFAYSSAESSRQEKRNPDGSVTGKYTYTDPNGKLVHVDYSADAANGFTAYGENIPTSPGPAPIQIQDTPAVQEARQKFLATYAREYARAQAVAAAAVIQETVKAADSIGQPLVNQIVQTPAIEISSPKEEPNSSLDTKVHPPASDHSKIIKLDATQSVAHSNSNNGVGVPIKTEKVAKSQPGPAYFYYVGVGGQPYYVTPPPGRPNTDFAVSVRATQLGAIPVAAVHDVQVPHYGPGIRNNQVRNQPMYVEIGKDYESPNHQYQYVRQTQSQQHNFGFRHTYSAQPTGQQQHYGTTTTVFTLPYFGYPAYIY